MSLTPAACGVVRCAQYLLQAFRQRGKVLMADGSETDSAPEVTPPKFIEMVKSVIRNFGNVGEAEVC